MTYFWLINFEFDKFLNIPRYAVNTIFMTGFKENVI